MKNFRTVTLIIVLLITLTFFGCGKKENLYNKSQDLSNTVNITFNYTKQKGTATNQFAVWIENEKGKYIKTLYVTKFTSTKGYKSRKEAIPTWVQKSQIGKENKEEIDEVTGATPKSGELSFVWDLKDNDGEEVPKGVYSFYVEGTTRWENRVIYSGEIEIGENETSVKGEPQYIGDEAKESDMIGEVVAKYNT